MEEAGDETQEEVEESSPPNPSHGARFKLFAFFEWTSFHLYKLEQHLSSAEQREAMSAAKIAFHFVMHVGEYHGFEEYLGTLHTAMTPGPHLAFSTRQEADTWLEKQPEPPPPAVIAIGHKLYSVGYNRLRSLRVLIRLPTQQELDSGVP